MAQSTQDAGNLDYSRFSLFLPLPSKTVMAIKRPRSGEAGEATELTGDALAVIDQYLTDNFAISKSAREYPVGDKEHIGPGLTVVLGRTGGGKTTFMRCLENDPEAYSRVVVLEPIDSLAELKSVAGRPALTFEEGMRRAASIILAGRCPLFDSGRALVYRSTGATGARGLNMGLFEYITQLNAALLLQRASMMLALNPLVEDEQFESFRQYVASSVQTVIVVNSAEYRDDQATVRASLATRPTRAATNVRLKTSLSAPRPAALPVPRVQVVPSIDGLPYVRDALSRTIS